MKKNSIVSTSPLPFIDSTNLLAKHVSVFSEDN